MLALAKIFSSGMVLQRQKPIPIWGSAAPGASVIIKMRHGETCAVAGEGGFWRAVLPVMEASLSETVTVSSGDEQIELTDVAVGEVWIAGGQSNMEFWLRYEKHREQEQTDYPELRFFDVPKIAYDRQDRDFDYSRMAVWRKAVGGERDFFSAVGYYFQKELSRELHVPVGVIGCNWGGTASCVWMDARSVEVAGPIWMERTRDAFRGVDMANYLKNQAQKPENDTGDPFHNPFNEFMLPRTPGQEEIDAFLAAQASVAPELGPCRSLRAYQGRCMSIWLKR